MPSMGGDSGVDSVDNEQNDSMDTGDFDEVNAGFDGFSGKQKAADQQGFNVDTEQGDSVDYNDTTGLTTVTPAKGVNTHLGPDGNPLAASQELSVDLAEMAGLTPSVTAEGGYTVVDYGLVDIHIDSRGHTLGTQDEAAADVLEALGITVSKENIAVTRDVVDVIASVVLHTPMITKVATGLKTGLDVALATEAIDKSTYDKLNSGLKAVDAVYGLYTGFKGVVSGIRGMQAGYTGLGGMITVMSVIDILRAVQRLDSALSGMGLSNVPSDAVVDAIVDGDSSATVVAIVDKITDNVNDGKYSAIGAIDDALDGTAEQYDYMAGGKYYGIKQAGGYLWHPLNTTNEVDAEKKSLLMRNDELVAVMQTDMLVHTNNELELKTGKANGNISYETLQRTLRLELLYVLSNN